MYIHFTFDQFLATTKLLILVFLLWINEKKKRKLVFGYRKGSQAEWQMVSFFHKAFLGKINKTTGSKSNPQNYTPVISSKRVSCVLTTGLCNRLSMGRANAMEPKYWAEVRKKFHSISILTKKVITNLFKHACYFIFLKAQ